MFSRRLPFHVAAAALCLLTVFGVAMPAFAQGAAIATPAFSLATWLGVDAGLTSGAFFGIIAASFIYLLSTWFAIRDRSQVYLMLMLLCLLVHMAATGGYLNRLSDNPLMIEFMKEGTLLLFYLFSTLFTLIYLEFDTTLPPVRYSLYLLVTLQAFTIGIGAVDLAFVRPWISMAELISLFALLVIGVIALLRRTGGAWAHLAAFSVVFLGNASNLPINWDVLGLAPPGGDSAAIAYALCAMLFAVVIASQFARRQAVKERELATSNERFRMAALGSNEGLYDWDMLSRSGYFSDRLRRILGLPISTEKNILKAWLRRIHPEDRKTVRKKLFAFLRNRKETTVTLEYRIVRQDKQILWISSIGVAVRHATTGKVLRLVGSVGDITEKKRAEARLRASETRFRSIAEAHPVPVLICTLKEGEILYASKGTESVLNLPIRELLGMSINRFFVDEDVRLRLMDIIRKTSAVDLYEATLQRSDYASFPASLSARLINYERRPSVVIGINDITEAKKAEDTIKEQEAALQQSEKLAALGGLLAGVAHELNNPLSVIVGQAVLMQETAKDEKTAQRAEKIHKSGERCSRIVKSFLALARRKPAERKATSINEVIESTLELLAFQLRTENIELVKRLAADLPPALADADQMTQVTTNLIINAKQVLQDREGQRRVTVESWIQDNLIHVAVSDNGPGVPKELTKRVFEPFFTTKPAGAGTGVGLSLCHNIVESHGGHIWVENNPGGGARFIFTCPLAIRTAHSGDHETVAAPLHVPPQKILIVDDEVELAQTLADILQPDGHDMMLVDNGRKALDALQAENFDVIISDLRMPVMDGPTLYRELEKNLPHYLSRIVFVTGDTLSTHVSDFIRTYALDVIEKPYTPDDVRRAIAARIGSKAEGLGASD
jgi:PAS domain S-box-containing protein